LTAFPPQTVTVPCPTCKIPITTQLYTIIDVAQDRELKQRFLSGQLNVATCPHCGGSGIMQVPLLYHDPAREFLGVLVPQETVRDEAERQQVIGRLTNTLMNGLPPEQRRGYMLAPRQFLTLQSLVDAILEAEGITKEMREAQRQRLQLIDRLLAVLPNDSALEAMVQVNDEKIDYEFMLTIAGLAESMAQSGRMAEAQRLITLREKILPLTTWGQKAIKQEKALAALGPKTTPQQLLEAIIAADDEDVVNALVVAGRPLIDYSFFQALTRRIERMREQGKEEEAQRLEKLRGHVLELTRRQDEAVRRLMEQTAHKLQAVVNSDNPVQALYDHWEEVDDLFMYVLESNLEHARQAGDRKAQLLLERIHEAAVRRMREEAPPEIRLINELLQAEYPEETQRLLKERRGEITTRLLRVMDAVAEDLRREGRDDFASKLKQIRSQAALLG